MCKYCEPGKGHEHLMYEDIDFGILGGGCILTSICGSVSHEKELQTYVNFGEGDVDECMTIKINYCPMCGRKLREVAE